MLILLVSIPWEGKASDGESIHYLGGMEFSPI
jgi:hypothetical protein